MSNKKNIQFFVGNPPHPPTPIVFPFDLNPFMSFFWSKIFLGVCLVLFWGGACLFCYIVQLAVEDKERMKKELEAAGLSKLPAKKRYTPIK